MSGLQMMQIASALLCVVAVVLNLWQSFRWRRLRQQMTPVCKVILHGDEMTLGIVGKLPEVGTVLYRLDAPAARKPKAHSVPV